MWKILSLLAFAAVQVHGVDPVVGNQKLWEQVPYSGLQSNADYEASYAKYQVDEVPATASLVSCYTPQLRSNVAFTQETGYSDPGSSNCTQAELDAAKAAGDSVGPYQHQVNVDGVQPVRVKSRIESQLRRNKFDTKHLIGLSLWSYNAEMDYRIAGFFESYDGGKTWPVAGHVPGFEYFERVEHPVGDFDAWGNFYALSLASVVSDEGKANPYLGGITQAVTVSIKQMLVNTEKNKAVWNSTKADGTPDYAATSTAPTEDDDNRIISSWMSYDYNAISDYFGRLYVMYALQSGKVFSTYTQTYMNGTHSAFSVPFEVPTPGPTYRVQFPTVRVDGAGIVWALFITEPVNQRLYNISIVWSLNGGVTWPGTHWVILNDYQALSHGIGIKTEQPLAFDVGFNKLDAGDPSFPLYAVFEDDGSADQAANSNIYITASWNLGAIWTVPVRVNDNTDGEDATHPSISVDRATGTVAVSFYDRRLPCYTKEDAERSKQAGMTNDPNVPYNATNYCITTAVQHFTPQLAALGHNIRMTTLWNPTLSAIHESMPHGSPPPQPTDPFMVDLGSYQGIEIDVGVTAVSTSSSYNIKNTNANNLQLQVVSRITTPGLEAGEFKGNGTYRYTEDTPTPTPTPTPDSPTPPDPFVPPPIPVDPPTPIVPGKGNGSTAKVKPADEGVSFLFIVGVVVAVVGFLVFVASCVHYRRTMSSLGANNHTMIQLQMRESLSMEEDTALRSSVGDEDEEA